MTHSVDKTWRLVFQNSFPPLFRRHGDRSGSPLRARGDGGPRQGVRLRGAGAAAAAAAAEAAVAGAAGRVRRVPARACFGNTKGGEVNNAAARLF